MCVLFFIVQESVMVYLSLLFECGTSLESNKGILACVRHMDFFELILCWWPVFFCFFCVCVFVVQESVP